MALHHDLLEQAIHLASRERRRPRQASLRRAVSSAYYALFHLLAAEGARRLSPNRPASLRFQVGRAFSHSEMKRVCQQFSARNPAPPTQTLVTFPIATELVALASAFVELQEARQAEDYDLSVVFDRADVLQKIRLTQRAFAGWEAIRGTPNAAVFIAALLLQRHWR